MTVRMRAMPMASWAAHVLDDNTPLLSVLINRSGDDEGSSTMDNLVAGQSHKQLCERLEHAAESAGRPSSEVNELTTTLSQIWALGPRHQGPNFILAKKVVDTTGGDCTVEAFCQLGNPGFPLLDVGRWPRYTAAALYNGDPPDERLFHEVWQTVEASVVSGFELAAAAGPLCDEPLWGVVLEAQARFNLTPMAGGRVNNPAENPAVRAVLDLDMAAARDDGAFSGSVITAVRELSRAAVLSAGPRLVEAYYLCIVKTDVQGLGGTYVVLGRRRARILEEDMSEGSGLFVVHAHLPMAASFGLADELRRKTSGAASVQLLLSHWERLPNDPFFVPSTTEELVEFGTHGEAGPNLARELVDVVRRRKGLFIEEKHVERATKQRTLTRNK